MWKTTNIFFKKGDFLDISKAFDNKVWHEGLIML